MTVLLITKPTIPPCSSAALMLRSALTLFGTMGLCSNCGQYSLYINGSSCIDGTGSSKAMIQWMGCTSFSFPVSCGMRQGSILSPTLFNIFLDELLEQLQRTHHGARVFDMVVNSCAYADDISLFAATVPGLQHLIDICVAYSEKYRFKFGLKRSKCVVIGKHPLITLPTWKLGMQSLVTDSDAEILGVTFEDSLTYSKHVQKRVTSCRQRIYGLTTVGMSYPGLASDTKAYIWKSVGAPMITYGMESVNLTHANLKHLKSAQATIIKRVMGIPKHSHHTILLEALNIPATDELIKNNVQRLFHRIFKCDSPAKDLQSKFLSHYLRNHELIPGSLLQRLVSQGVSPVKTIFNKPGKWHNSKTNDGIMDSLQSMLFHDNYIKPHSNEHVIATLLLKAF